MMAKDRSLTEKILNLTLEIMYLLTREDYIVVKLFSDNVAPSSHGTGEFNRIQSPMMRPSQSSLIPEENHEKRILELTNKIIALLTEEVPVRCQDVAVYLSMEEQEYLEEHKDLYKEAMMEDQPPSDTGKTLEECLITPQEDITQDPEEPIDPKIDHSQDLQVDPIDLKLEISSDSEDLIEIFHPGLPNGEISPHPIPEESSSSRSHTVFPYIHHEFHSMDGSAEPKEESPLVNFHTVLSDLQPTHHSIDSSLDPSETQKSSHCRSSTATDGSSELRFRVYACPECGKCFPKNAELVRHLRTHTGERPYSCPECHKRFTQNANLIRHQRIHTGVKPYACPECGKRFSGKSDVSRHQKVHLLKKPWPCYECCRCFSRKSDFIRHQDSHRLPKQFTCSM